MREFTIVDVTIPASGVYSDEINVARYAWATLHLIGSHDGTTILFKTIGAAGDTAAPAFEEGAAATRAVTNACAVDVPSSALGYALSIASDATAAISARLVLKD